MYKSIQDVAKFRSPCEKYKLALCTELTKIFFTQKILGCEKTGCLSCWVIKGTALLKLAHYLRGEKVKPRDTAYTSALITASIRNAKRLSAS